MVLTPGVCASRLVVMRRPDRARASAIRKATGAIVHRSPGSNCVEVARRSAGLKAGAGAPPPPAASGLDPVRSPVFRACKRSAEAERSCS
ncbi:hypothetical protein EAV90_06745, partial [Bradyrhizobium vignae]